jgi:hypothetical protein
LSVCSDGNACGDDLLPTRRRLDPRRSQRLNSTPGAADIYLVRGLVVFLLFLFALLTFALHRSVKPAQASTADLGLSRIASEIARRDVSIRCEGASGEIVGVDGESGRTEFFGKKPADESFLLEGICQRLHTYARLSRSMPDCSLPCDGSAIETAWSLNALAHESYHLAGIRNEARTECYALQAIDFVARELGADEQQARQLAIFAFNELPERMPDEYSSPECRNGGKLDLRPNDPVWP